MDQPKLEVPDDNLKKLPVRFISDVYAGDYADQHTKDQPITVRFSFFETISDLDTC